MTVRPLTPAEYRAQIAKGMSEGTLLEKVRQTARELGYLTYHTHDSRRSEPGFPDLVLVHGARGRVVFAELKDMRRRVEPDQEMWLDRLRAAGAEAYVWRPIHLLDESIVTVLTTRPKETSRG